jgi:hypothetical protein
MEIIKWANLTLRFLLELAALVALGYWGFHGDRGTLMKVGLGLGTPLAAAIVWAIFGAPKSDRHLTGGWYVVLEVVAFGSACIALAAARQTTLAAVFAAVVVVNAVLLRVLGE